MEAQSVKFIAPGRAELVKETLPEEAPGKHEILMRTECSLISPGTELALFGSAATMASGFYPFQPGYAAVGEVLAVGDGITGVNAGERILAHAPHTSLACFDASHTAWAKVPQGVDSQEAAFVRLATVSMTTLRTTAARAGDQVAVIGLGPVGYCAAQVFHAAGYRVTGLDLVGSRCKRLRSTGINALQPEPEVLTEFKQKAGGAQLVIEATGSTQALLTAIDIAATGGEISLVGFNWGRKSGVDASDIFSLIFQKFLRVRSGSEWELPIKEESARVGYQFYGGATGNLGAPFTPGSIDANTRFAFQLLEQGRLSFKPAVSHVIHPAHAQQAYEGLLNNKDSYHGVILDWTSAATL